MNEDLSRSKNKHVTFKTPLTNSERNSSSTSKPSALHHANVPLVNSTRVSLSTKASESKPSCNTKNDRTSLAESAQRKKVEDHPRNNKNVSNEKNRVDSSISHKRAVINSNSDFNCVTCNDCLINDNHDECLKWFLKASYSSPVKTEKNVFRENLFGKPHEGLSLA